MWESVHGRRKVFVSFDYDNDKRYKFLLCAWHANKQFDLKFDDHSSGEIQSDSIGRVKAALTAKIADAEVVLVIIGKEANKWHSNWREIGFINWQNFEIAKAKELGKRLVAVKLDRSFESPEQLKNAGTSWAMSFSDEAVTKALREA